MELLQGFQFLAEYCLDGGEEVTKKLWTKENVNTICQNLIEILELETSNQLRVC